LAPGLILLIHGGHYGPAQMERVMAAVEGFLSRVPTYVRDDLAKP
jgi:hypothetical protein